MLHLRNTLATQQQHISNTLLELLCFAMLHLAERILALALVIVDGRLQGMLLRPYLLMLCLEVNEDLVGCSKESK